jgi:hypothetical protein
VLLPLIVDPLMGSAQAEVANRVVKEWLSGESVTASPSSLVITLLDGILQAHYSSREALAGVWSDGLGIDSIEQSSSRAPTLAPTLEATRVNWWTEGTASVLTGILMNLKTAGVSSVSQCPAETFTLLAKRLLDHTSAAASPDQNTASGVFTRLSQHHHSRYVARRPSCRAARGLLGLAAGPARPVRIRKHCVRPPACLSAPHRK